MMLSGEAIDPALALARGVIDELRTPGALIERAVELARSRASAPSYASVKAQLRRETFGAWTRSSGWLAPAARRPRRLSESAAGS